MRNDIKKLLGLQNIWIDSWKISTDKVIVSVRNPRTHCMCPRCSCTTSKVHQYTTRTVKHSIWQEKEVLLHVKVRRFYCKHCNRPFTEYFDGIDRRNSTQNYRNILLKQLSHSSINHTAQTTKCSSSVLYAVLRENYEKRRFIDWKDHGYGIILGIDEHSYRGHTMALTLTNITKRELIAVLENDKKETLDLWLKNVESERISEVCIDMRRMFLYSAKKYLPHAKVTVDQFHVIAYANKMMDTIRTIIVPKRNVRRLLFKGKEKLSKKEQIKLQELFVEFKAYPSLYEAYFIKEKLRSFYTLRDKRKAVKQLGTIIMYCENAQSRYMKSLGRTLVFWREYILNYFDHYSTNAFTEGVHTKIKMIKRMSFGFRNIHNYIAKITLAFVPLLLENLHTY